MMPTPGRTFRLAVTLRQCAAPRAPIDPMRPAMRAIDLPLSKPLKALPHAGRGKLDNSIMTAASFQSLEGYRRFVRVQ